MRLTILLQERKGDYVAHFVQDFPNIPSLSDAAQRMPHYYISYNEGIFGFKAINAEDAIIFRRKELLSCA